MPLEMDQLALDALTDLGGDTRAVPGARLASHIARRARSQNVDFHAWLREQGLSFKAYIRRAGIRVTDFQGSDILVSLQTADVPTSPTPHSFARREQIRKDVYDAFTRIEPGGYAYLHLSDNGRFVPAREATNTPAIPVPALTFSDLLQVRNDFVDSIEEGSAAESSHLRTALNSANPLRRFTTTLLSTNKLDAWRKYLHERLEEKIKAWATQQGVTIREDWFRNANTTRGEGIAEGNRFPNLRRLLASLSDDEIGEIMIPGHLIERALKR